MKNKEIHLTEIHEEQMNETYLDWLIESDKAANIAYSLRTLFILDKKNVWVNDELFNLLTTMLKADLTVGFIYTFIKKLKMFPKAIPYFLSLFVLSFCTKADSYTDFTELFALPKSIKESSGVEVTAKSNLIWTIQDHGNEPKIFGLNDDGKIAHQSNIINAENIDWEDITSDKEGNLYIGDFGNNKNDRQDLAIYKIDGKDLTQKNITSSNKINFYYPEQKDFPPKKSNRIFDVEAFFIFKDNFYLFTKNRSSKFDGTTSLYKVPNASGNHAAELISSFKTCENFNHCAITSADISPSGKTIALLSSDQVWLFSNFKKDDFFTGEMKNIQLPNFTQKEGLTFLDENTLYITDEKDKKTGGNLYKLNLLKSKAETN